jgi:Rod binding domain-containing protein
VTAGIDAIGVLPPSRPEPATAPREMQEAAKQFEAIFVRQLLSSLERTTQGSAGGVYGSMVVGTMADAIAEAGGLGLRQEILHALSAGEASTNGDY